MGIHEEISANSFVPVTKSRISNYWKSIGLQPSDLQWYKNSAKSTDTVHEQLLLLKVPENLTGHQGIAHGGFIATILDEALCFGAYPVLPHKTGVTASLNVDYLLPTPAGSWIAIHSIAHCEKGSRKATVNAEIYEVDPDTSGSLPWDTDAKPQVKAKQIVVEPKWYEKLTHLEEQQNKLLEN